MTRIVLYIALAAYLLQYCHMSLWRSLIVVVFTEAIAALKD